MGQQLCVCIPSASDKPSISKEIYRHVERKKENIRTIKNEELFVRNMFGSGKLRLRSYEYVCLQETCTVFSSIPLLTPGEDWIHLDFIFLFWLQMKICNID